MAEQQQRKFGAMPCLAGTKRQVIPRRPNSYGHAVMGKTMTLTEDRLAPTECGVGMVVLFIVTL